MKPLSTLKTIPFKGGCKPFTDIPLLKSGEFSILQNMRNLRPGLEARKGCRVLHTVADSTNQVMNLFQFSKGRRTEQYLFAQMSDGDVLQATAMPPTITTGAFGSEVFDGTATGHCPASFAVVDDAMLYTNGSDKIKIFPGDARELEAFIVVKGTAAADHTGAQPMKGEDYTQAVRSDDITGKTAILDSLGDYGTDYDAIYVCTEYVPKEYNVTLAYANATESVLKGYYWNGAAWTDLSITDGTISSAKTLAQNGSITFTAPTAWKERLMFGRVGYWCRFNLDSGDLDSETEIATMTYDAGWQSIINMWDGVMPYIIEAQFYDDSEAYYLTYAAAAVDVSDATSSDILYVSSYDPLFGLYINVGATPNNNAATMSVYYWDGDSWAAVTDLADGTTSGTQSGYVTWDRIAIGTEQPQMFQGTMYYAYWYKITFSATLSASLAWSFECLPWFDVEELGTGRCCCAWKNRAVYSFQQYPQYIYIAAQDTTQTLNGDDYGILVAGDGRANKIVAMRQFYNELLVWQEEKGTEGGTITLFEGYSPSTFGKLLLSSRLGTLNSKSVAVVDGVMTSTETEQKIQTLCFCLSHYGVYVTNGRIISMISDDIQDYFDPTNSTYCIRKGYEDQMWLNYDSAHNVIRVGLVTGSSATVCNTFLVYDIIENAWSIDVLQQPLACMQEVEAGSGAVQTLQIGGGTGDGFVYQLNYGTNDVSTAVSAIAQLEFDGGGYIINLDEMIIRCYPQSAGNITLATYRNGVATGVSKSLSMLVENSSETVRRHRFRLNCTGNHVGLRLSHNTAGEAFKLLDWSAKLMAYENQ